MFALIKTGLPTQFPCDFQDKQTTAEQAMQQVKHLVGNPLLYGNPVSRKKFHDKLFILLSSSMKLGPKGLCKV